MTTFDRLLLCGVLGWAAAGLGAQTVPAPSPVPAPVPAPGSETRPPRPAGLAPMNPGGSGGASGLAPLGPQALPDPHAPLSPIGDAVPEPGRNSLGLALVPGRGEGSVYYDGEQLALRVRADRDVYFALYHIGADGRVQRIFPHGTAQDNRLRAGDVLTLPNAQTPWLRYYLHGPFGREYLKAVASVTPLALEPDPENLPALPRGRRPSLAPDTPGRAEALTWFEVSGY